MSEGGASVLVIGDELLSGEIADTNGPYFSERLTARGFEVREVRILPDDRRPIVEAVRSAMEGARVVLVSGGLGPTSDDRTTEALAAACGGRAVRLDSGQWEVIRERFRTLGLEAPPPGNEKQAMLPEGAEVLPNEHGTAPGYVLREGDAVVAVLPGPPRENRPMFEDRLGPWLDRNLAGIEPWNTRAFRVFGLPESEVGHRLTPVEQAYPSLRVSYRFSFPEIVVKIRCRSRESRELEAASRELHERLAPFLYGEKEAGLAETLGRTLAARGWKVVTAESCTGGLVAQLLTETPGSSAWMDRGFVVYTNESKQEVLGVPPDVLATHGAVSEPVALAMLRGALERSRAEVGLALTGIAGPTGGTADKPVGTVCIAWGGLEGSGVRTFRFRWDRAYNRLVSAWAAIHHLRVHLMESDVSGEDPSTRP